MKPPGHKFWVPPFLDNEVGRALTGVYVPKTVQQLNWPTYISVLEEKLAYLWDDWEEQRQKDKGLISRREVLSRQLAIPSYSGLDEFDPGSLFAEKFFVDSEEAGTLRWLLSMVMRDNDDEARQRLIDLLGSPEPVSEKEADEEQKNLNLDLFVSYLSRFRA